MPDTNNNINTSHEFQLITGKRLALESLIRIVEGVHQQQSALNELALAAKPSQDFPQKVVKYFDAISKHLKDSSVAEIIQKLDKLEVVTLKTLEQVLLLADLNVNELRDNQIKNLDVDAFAKLIEDFKHRTRTALSLRFVLKDRGVVVPAFKLPVSQEIIGARVEKLKQKEVDCVKQIRNEIEVIIADTNLLLAQTTLPEEIINELKKVKKGMMVNLQHLDSGGSVLEIPNVFEVIILETVSFDEPALNQPNQEAPAEMVKEKLPSKLDVKKQEPVKSFWWLLKTWLSSPWSTSWSSLKKKHRQK